MPPSRPAPYPLLAALAIVSALLAVGCATVDRTITDRDFLQNEQGIVERSVVWESNRYPDQQVHAGDPCWEAAVIGQPVPAECLGTRVRFAEADPYEQIPWAAILAAVLAILAAIWFAFRRIAWQPRVARSVAADGDTPPDAVALMRGIQEERSARRLAGAARRDVRRPLPTGAALAAAALLPAILLFGYAAALSWAVNTGVIMLLGLAVATIWLLLRLPPKPPDPDAHISRLLFLAGVTAVCFGGAFVVSFIAWPMQQLHGIWLLG